MTADPTARSLADGPRATWTSPAQFPEAAAIGAATPALLRRQGAGHEIRVIDPAARLTAGQLLRAVAGDQARLRAAGVARGAVVCMQLPNWWQAVTLAHAAWGMGAVLCPVPVNYRSAEIAAILSAVPVAAFVAPQEYRGTAYPEVLAEATRRSGTAAALLPVSRGTPPPAAPGPGSAVTGAELAEAGAELAEAGAELDADLDEVCLLMFTSGTTGRPKGVLHSHRTLLAEAASISGLFGMDRDRVYMPSPLAHITGLVYGVLMPLLMDGMVVLQPEWDPDAGASLVERHGCTVCVGATPFLHGLTGAYRRRGQRSALRAFICGGADVPPALVREAEQVLGTTVARAYGLTEMPTVTCGGPDDPLAVRAGTDGRLTGSSQARLAGVASAADGTGEGRGDEGQAGEGQAGEGRAGEGRAGELEVRGPELCLGYLDPADTAASFTADGWFRTGDLARLGPGRTVTIAGRAKDIIVRAGENISVKEIEDYLAEHPAITEVAIVGVPDAALGERACAFVVSAGPPPALADLSAFLISRDIARHKLPEHLIVVPGLPRTPSGKVQKFLLRQQASRLLAAGQGESR